VPTAPKTYLELAEEQTDSEGFEYEIWNRFRCAPSC